MVYVLSRLAKTWNDKKLAAAALNLVPRIVRGIDQDGDFDLTDGAAGAIIGLAFLHWEFGENAETANAIERCADHLVAKAKEQQEGIGWHIRLSPEHALAGMAHGGAGVAWALAEAWCITGRNSHRAAARQALAYERTLYDSHHHNWRDLRSHEEEQSHSSSKFMASWCHGAPGIGLARLGIYARMPEESTRREIEIACQTTLRQTNDDNHSLCHGLLGDLDCLTVAGQRFGSGAEWPAPIKLQNLEGWRCGIPVDMQIPGLMLGLAGIGYGLLRVSVHSEA